MSDLLNKASLVMVPSGYKEDTVYSVVPTDGSGDLSFTRASNGTRINSAGLVEDCPWNLLQYSETFNTSWTASNVTITANDTTAPNGTITAEKALCASGSSISPNIFYSGSLPCTSGQVYTYSYYAKKGTTNFAKIRFSGTAFASVTNTPVFNLNTGVVVSGAGTIEDVGNGWYRISATATAETNANGVVTVDIPSSTGVWPNGNFSGTEYIYIWGAQLNIGSTANPYFPTTDRLNVPRLTYQNGGGGCPSLLLEKQSTNLVTYSQDFSNAAWNIIVNSGCSLTITPNYTTASNGLPATRLVASRTNTSTLAAIVNYAPNTSTNATKSIWMKNNNSGNVTIMFGDEAVTITDSWERYSVANTYVYAIIGLRYSGVALSCDISMTGYQFELGSYPTSYIPTTSSSATRVADACSKTGISSLIGQTQGSVFFDFTVDTISSQTNNPVLWYMKDGGAGERYVQLIANGNLEYVETNGSIIAYISKSGLTVGRHKCAIAYAPNDMVFYVDGVQIGTDTSGNPSGFSTFSFQYYISVYDGQQKVNQCVIFPTRLTNAELASLTTL